jgi:hypothetical protein
MNTINLRIKIKEILQEHKVANSMEICRLCNGQSKEDYRFCNRFNEFGANRGWDKVCSHEINKCQIYWRQIYEALHQMEKKHWIYSKKLRFWDKGRALPTDTFRFWFINKKDFNEQILRQTLVPYIQKEGEQC